MLHSLSYRMQDIPAVKMTIAFEYVFHIPFRIEISPDPFLGRVKHRIVTQMEQAACRMAAMSWFPSKQIEHYHSTSYPQWNSIP